MSEYLSERFLRLPINSSDSKIIEEVEDQVLEQMMPGESPVRFAVTESEDGWWNCDIGIRSGGESLNSIFEFKRRASEDTNSFNAVMLVPTGIGAEIGGHAGDATPAAAIISSVCDTLITHPNVLNASDIIQVPPNALYVEGSVISQLMMGTIGINPTRANRLLVVIQDHEDELFKSAAVNAVNAARASYGLEVCKIVQIDSRFRMIAEHTATGVAAGQVMGLDYLWEILDQYSGDYDAVAINSVIEVPPEFHREYYEERGAMVNPWGGVEAMLTHAVSTKYGVPAAHSPMFESREISEMDLGVVDSRMAAEVVSVTFLQCILRGLQYSPRIVSPLMRARSIITVENLACLVVPEGCLGLPTLAALQQGITVITVRENRNIMRNNLDALPWRAGQHISVDNYWEAAGVLSALRVGLDPYSVRRPLRQIQLDSSGARFGLDAQNGSVGNHSLASLTGSRTIRSAVRDIE